MTKRDTNNPFPPENPQHEEWEKLYRWSERETDRIAASVMDGPRPQTPADWALIQILERCAELDGVGNVVMQSRDSSPSSNEERSLALIDRYVAKILKEERNNPLAQQVANLSRIFSGD